MIASRRTATADVNTLGHSCLTATFLHPTYCTNIAVEPFYLP